MTSNDRQKDLEPDEPGIEQWVVLSVDGIGNRIEGLRATDAPLVVAVDGRSASGKSTVAELLASVMPDAAIVHTDDLAWHEPLFEWAPLLRDGILRPVRAQGRVSFTPPQWRARGRMGSIAVPAGTRTLIVEGVGAAHASVTGLLDAV